MAHPRTDVRYDLPPSAARGRFGGAETARETRRVRRVGAPSANGTIMARRLGMLAALLIVAGGYVHFCLYRHGYRFIPKIGVGFMLQFTSSAVLAGALLLKGRELHLGRRSLALDQLIRLSAIALSVGTLAALGMVHTPAGLFQFHEIGLRPAPQSLLAIVAEALATIVLVIAMLEAHRGVTGLETPVAVPSRGPETVREVA